MSDNHLLINILKPSRQLVLLLALMHGLAAWSLLLLPYSTSIELFVKSFLLMLVMISFFYYYKKIKSIVAIVMKSDNRWDLLKSDGVYCVDNQLVSSYVSDWIVILGFSRENDRGILYTCLSVDAVDQAILCELKCMLTANGKMFFQE